MATSGSVEEDTRGEETYGAAGRAGSAGEDRPPLGGAARTGEAGQPESARALSSGRTPTGGESGKAGIRPGTAGEGPGTANGTGQGEETSGADRGRRGDGRRQGLFGDVDSPSEGDVSGRGADARDGGPAGPGFRGAVRDGGGVVPAGAGALSGAREEDEFKGMLENQDGELFEGTFWEAVERGVLPKPPCAWWNDWQAWRRRMGETLGLWAPRGTRGAVVQGREAKLWRAAMDRYYPGTRRDDRQASGERAASSGSQEPGAGARRPELSARRQARAELQAIFSPTETPVPSTAAGTAAASEYCLNRAGRLLTSLEDYDSHLEKVNRVLTLGQHSFPEVFTDHICKKMRCRVSILRDTYIAMKTDDPKAHAHRDSAETGPALAEEFMRRYKGQGSPEMFSPGMHPAYDAYCELLEAYGQPDLYSLWKLDQTGRG